MSDQSASAPPGDENPAESVSGQPAEAGGAATAGGPVAESDRILSLDLIRGVAVLGILLMNAVHFAYGGVAYRNISVAGSDTGLDMAVAMLGEIFVDQKFMGIFSLLFGAGIFLFIERAARREGRPILLNLWRNILLLGIGIIHMIIWEGDVLTAYALSAFVLLLLRRLPSRAMIVLGIGIFVASALPALFAQGIVNGSDVSLEGLWTPGDESLMSASVETQSLGGLLVLAYFMRALGLILAGAGLYQTGFMQGRLSADFYKLTAVVGLGAGLTLAAAGVIITYDADYTRSVAFVGEIPNTLGTIPASLGYMSLIILWQKAGGLQWLKQRLIAVGRMALTNYLSQTVFGVVFLTYLLADIEFGRASVLLFILAVWLIQLWWSQAWLNRFRFGPMEWLWRVGTYRARQPLRR